MDLALRSCEWEVITGGLYCSGTDENRIKQERWLIDGPVSVDAQRFLPLQKDGVSGMSKDISIIPDLLSTSHGDLGQHRVDISVLTGLLVLQNKLFEATNSETNIGHCGTIWKVDWDAVYPSL